MVNDGWRVLCGAGNESRDHLLSVCAYSRLIWNIWFLITVGVANLEYSILEGKYKQIFFDIKITIIIKTK